MFPFLPWVAHWHYFYAEYFVVDHGAYEYDAEDLVTQFKKLDN